ncbi:chemotaxis-specific protein-glutamate methyltransferase CheB [Anaerocolumna sp.]|uniref:chemotaxis-specific protein-glutamate methyltransferase CheB n=1 Tax=Anaerocolumna sp. TaxID=2041569 RepID=UPI0028ABAA43|nr:chemotaxis-specific protein-glutamate methyltransferase CheB [Anaerocolumna sp.]
MQKKVLIVDDSALMRRVLSDIINSDTRFCVFKIVSNGLEALNLLIQDKEEFDAILLDINMPVMGGIEFLKELGKRKINAAVIVVSTVAKEGAKETIQALELGAFDFVTKPESFLDVKSNRFRDKIINTLTAATNSSKSSIKSLIEEETDKSWKTQLTYPKQQTLPVIKNNHQSKSKGITGQNKNKLIAIACSTGGPKALQKIIPLLPSDLACSVLIVQHMPEGFTHSLANRLNETSKLKVKEAEQDDILQKGVVYVAKGGYHMRLTNQGSRIHKIAITKEEARNGLRPCADIMYESLVDADFDEIICVVLTGMGSDGTRGIKLLHEKKNIYVIAQDEATSTVYGMPKVITETGLVNEILPLDQIAGAIRKNMGD